MAQFKAAPAPEPVDGLGVLIANLGTPAAPTAAALRPFLAEFLSDPRVVELPRLKWWPVLHGIVLRRRPARSARLYRNIWTADGSPLLVTTRAIADGLAARLRARLGREVAVEIGMRYGEPSIARGLDALRGRAPRRLVVLPLYPQYSGATTGSTFDAVAAEIVRWRRVPELHFIGDYHDEPAYIAALAAGVRQYWSELGRPDRLLLSFHGIPERQAAGGDPYPQQCRRTAELLWDALELPADNRHLAFQSRFGREPWLRPYTDETLMAWARAGVERVDTLCPGFAADCLETLEEIAITNRERFLHAGGRDYRYLPALNTRPEHLEILTRLVLRAVGEK